jgi:threonine/homoserine/homoserine lactone efflux protein
MLHRTFFFHLIMSTETLISSSLLFTWSAYTVMCASPGPTILAIMGTAMGHGRRSALMFSLGAVCGSMFWGMLTALGLSAVLMRYSQLLIVLKIAGGLYLLWLAFRSARAACSSQALTSIQLDASDMAPKRLYLRGLGFHLTNPKAIMTWLSIVSLAFPQGGTVAHALVVVGGCNIIAVCVFCGYALLFSAPVVRRVYVAIRRWMEATLAVVFGVAGLKLLVLQD